MIKLVDSQDQFSFVFNGRFKGGHITRFYGNPAGGVHAIQLEMAQCLYMDEAAPFGYRPDLAAEVQPLLRELLEAAVQWVRQ
jgi:N-formylglutamate deformylase